MGAYYYIFVSIIGLSLGSFFNVIIFRFNTGQSAIKGRSKCLNCRSTIKWLDLIPIFSYFVLKGRCRQCQKKISLLYPIVEISSAVAVLLLFLEAPAISYSIFLSSFIVSLFVLLIFLDIRYFIIPDSLLILLTVAIIISKFISNNTDFYQLSISALGLTAFFAILFLASRGKWIGLGDIKLIFLISLLLEYPMNYLAIISSVWLAALFSIILLIKKRATAKTEIPFGSFLSVITIIFIIFNNELQKVSQYFY